MRLRSRPKMDDPFDGLTAEEVRRIRGMAAANVTPGMEGLAKAMAEHHPMTEAEALDAIERAGHPHLKRKRGRRA